jgi:putative heme-binding domain-containing protein
VQAEDYKSLFDGKTLTGWDGNAEFWSVKDGEIYGETTKENPTKANTFLIWKDGEVADFDLKLQVKYSGNNSGVQYRSEIVDPAAFTVKGYQCDLHPNHDYFGMLYAERWRGIVATRGQKVVVTGADKKDVTVTALPKDERKLVDDEWNEVRIIAVGNRIIHQINGVTTMDLTDDYPDAPRKGILALQLHAGPPMKCQFKDIQLKKLDDKTGPEVLKSVAQVEPAVFTMPSGFKIVSNNPMPEGPQALEGAKVTVPAGFECQLLYNVPLKEQGSWVSMTVDNKGRLVVSDEKDKGLYQIEINETPAEINLNVSKLPVNMSGVQGMLLAFDGLYVQKNGAGVFKLTDTNNDGLVDASEAIPSAKGGGEHGNHALVLTPDQQKIFVDSGNHTDLPELASKRVPIWYEGHLLPRQWDARGHARGRMAPGGWVTILDPVKKTQELFCVGFRNEYDIALNTHGDLFTYDADMEWDLGMPWYRPTRICHVVSGGDFGWRSGTGKWPAYYEDSLPAVIDIGPGSPTGVVMGTGAKFPPKYQQALFALDWTFGTIYAIHFKPEGASYTAVSEPFAVGSPFPVTDAVIGKDGALYFTVGGRGTQSALYRVIFRGAEATTPTEPKMDAVAAKAHAERKALEAFHGVVNPEAVAKAWPYLASQDRFLRYAARLAIESQPVSQWASKVFTETDPQSRITAAVALARMGEPAHKQDLLKLLLSTDLKTLSEPQLLGLLRAYALTFIKFSKPNEATTAAVIAQLDPLLPHKNADVNLELLNVLVYLDAPGVAEKALQLIEHPREVKKPEWSHLVELNKNYGSAIKAMLDNYPPSQEIAYAFALRNLRHGWNLDQRHRYFTFINRASKASGGASFPGFLANIRDDALALCTNDERLALKEITGEDFNPVPNFEIKPIVGPGKKWTVDMGMAESGSGFPKANFEKGRSLYFAANCGKCHRFNGLGGGVGPDLTSIRNKFDVRYLLESIVDPSKVISDQYQSSNVVLSDGKSYQGLVIKEGDNYVIYPSDLNIKEKTVSKDDVLELEPSPVSQMPLSLIDNLNKEELRDLLAYLMSGGNAESDVYGKKKK